ncbi:MAG: dihydrolipoyl dehydrogenase [Alphaproteobacteria bacterium]|nr:dihydrolipoyl dehydrogenase [Alphaproteobacteria bacterium]
MVENTYDLVVIGGGPGGYVAAIRAAQLGMTVACVEGRGALGGTCLNVGCIPSKALLHSSELYEQATHGFADHGIAASGVKVDVAKMLARKDQVVLKHTKGVEFLLKKNKVAYVQGWGAIAAPGTVAVKLAKGGTDTLKAKRIVIATGSEVTPLANVAIDEKQIVSSTGGLVLDHVPRELIVIGGGYIGLELGSVWRRLGAKVTVVEFLDRVTPNMDSEISKEMQKILTKQGMAFRLSTKVTAAKPGKNGVAVTVEPAAGGAPETLTAGIVLVSIGRRPYTAGLGLEAVGVKRDNAGRIVVDHAFATSVKDIYAIGDVIAGPMLAHKASEDGIACVETIAGRHGHVDYNLVPGVVYTWPEAAAVGKTEEQLKAEGVAYTVGKFPFTAVSRATVNGHNQGFIKILADRKTDRALGCHIVGPDAGTLIHEAVAVMAFGGSAEDIAMISHAHPTLAEGMKEAALAVAGRALHV